MFSSEAVEKMCAIQLLSIVSVKRHVYYNNVKQYGK